MAGPEDFDPTGERMKVVGAFNPGVTMEDDDTVLMIRVAEAPVDEPRNSVMLPYFDVENRADSPYRISFDVLPESAIKSIGKKDVMLRAGTSRLRHLSHPVIARSIDGTSIDEIEDTPSFYPCFEHERFGMEDFRITKIDTMEPDELGFYMLDDESTFYALTYVSPHRIMGVSTSIAVTGDFRQFYRMPSPDHPQHIFTGIKDVAIFPGMFNIEERGVMLPYYAALTRPNAFSDISSPGIWMSFSPDWIHWGRDTRVIVSMNGEVTGTGSPAVRTDGWWLGAFHEVTKEGDKSVYRGKLWGMRPKEALGGRSNEFMLYTSPVLMEPNEFKDVPPGYVPNVVYPSGMAVRDGMIDIYSGEDDTYVSVRRYESNDLIKFLKSGDRRIITI